MVSSSNSQKILLFFQKSVMRVFRVSFIKFRENWRISLIISPCPCKGRISYRYKQYVWCDMIGIKIFQTAVGWTHRFILCQNCHSYPCLKLIEIVNVWVYYTIPICFSLFWHFKALLFNCLNYFVLLKITDEDSVLEIRIWSIMLIISNLKWCIYI